MANVLVSAINKNEEIKKVKALQFMANNLSVQEIERLEEMARSSKARDLLNNNWAMLQSFI